MRSTHRPRPPTRPRTLFPRLTRAAIVGAAIVAPLAFSLDAAQAAGEFHARLVGYESLRPSALASAAATDRHLYTLREFDPLVQAKYNTISADPEKDLTIAIYGPGDNAFGQGAVIRLAGGRAVPATVVVPSGVPVFFRNDDPFVHHLIGPDVERDLKPGESHKIAPKAKGVTTFTDTLTPSVKAWVVVEDGVIANRWAGLDGAVKIQLEGNEYTFKAFFEGNAKATVPNFKVPDKGSADAKDIVVAPPVGSGK